VACLGLFIVILARTRLFILIRPKEVGLCQQCNVLGWPKRQMY